MTPERWRQITDVFHAARGRDAAARAMFLDEACGGDQSLRADVDTMLAADGEAGTFGETPVFAPAATVPRLQAGATLGPYRIDERIGAGGMGEVYRAHDARLDRAVAIKVLYSGDLADSAARLRLLGEARSAAALNHPHICTIHEVGEAGGQAYIAMELIQGQPLERLIPVGGFPVDDLLRYGIQIADAMAYAHRRGILHRDLKPANVMISELGMPKILDFGLARAFPVVARRDWQFTTSQTATDSVFGTAAYMSPEQAMGHATDERSDIFSCGVMLYEMATGRNPFAGATPPEVLGAVLHSEPQSVAKTRRDLPARLSLVVQKALAKDPSQRYQHMSDLSGELRRLQRPPFGMKASALTGVAAVVILLLVVAGSFVPRSREEASVASPARIIQLTTHPGLEYSPAWSPDGRSIAYVSNAAGNLDIYVQQTENGQTRRLTDSIADDAQPAWSPDGSRIAFVSARAYGDKRLSMLIGMSPLHPLRNGDVWVVPAHGGTARRIAEDAYDPAWAPDGKKIVYAGVGDGDWGLWIREVDTPSQPRRVTVGALNLKLAPSAFERAKPVIQPAWSPDGKWIAFTAGRGPFLRVFAVPSEGGQAAGLTPADINTQMPSWSPDGAWLYFSSERSGRVNLYKARFQDGRLGMTHQVTAGGGADLQARLDPQGRRTAYSNVRDVLDLWEYDLTSRQTIRLTSETTGEDNARPSPDGEWLAFASNRLNGNHLWLLNRRTGGLIQVSTDSNYSLHGSSRWSWDGRYLFYSRSADERGSTIWQYEVSTGVSRRLFEGDVDFCVSTDDKHLILAHRSGDFVRVDLTSGRREVFGRLAAAVPSDLVCSADGQSVAFHAYRGDDRDIWVMPLTGGAPLQLTSGNNEDSHPAWSADSRFVYFLRNHQDIYVVPRTGGEAKSLTDYRSFTVTLDYPAVSGDGKKILFTRIDKAGDIYILEQSPDK